MIASHLDVVPASNESWEVPPFEGRIKDGYIWGRGTLDVKNGVMVSAEELTLIALLFLECFYSLLNLPTLNYSLLLTGIFGSSSVSIKKKLPTQERILSCLRT